MGTKLLTCWGTQMSQAGPANELHFLVEQCDVERIYFQLAVQAVQQLTHTDLNGFAAKFWRSMTIDRAKSAFINTSR
jgi:hypothetical protein